MHQKRHFPTKQSSFSGKPEILELDAFCASTALGFTSNSYFTILWDKPKHTFYPPDIPPSPLQKIPSEVTLAECSNILNPLITTLEPQSNYGPSHTAIRWLVHWPLMGRLLHLVQRGGDWAEPQLAQAPPRCTKCRPLTARPSMASVPTSYIIRRV